MLLCKKIDLDLSDPADAYSDAQETIKYLSDLVSSLNTRVLGGERIPGFALVEGRATRQISKTGYDYLEKRFGRDKVYKTVERPIGIGDLEKMVTPEEMANMVTGDVVVYVPGSPKVVVTPSAKQS